MTAIAATDDPWSEPLRFGTVKPCFRFVNLSAPFPPTNYMCEGLDIYADGSLKINALIGRPGIGRKALAAHLAVSFVTGEPAFGVLPCQQCNVMWLGWGDANEARGLIWRAAQSKGLRETDLDARLSFHQMHGALSERELGKMRAHVAENDIDVVFIDSYELASGNAADPDSMGHARLAMNLARAGGRYAAMIAIVKSDERVSDVGDLGVLGSYLQTAIIAEKAEFGRIRLSSGRHPYAFEPFKVRLTDGNETLDVKMLRTRSERKKGAQ